MTAAAHSSRNSMFWRRDEFVAEAAKHPGWASFHRACGRHGLFFDDIDPIGDDGKHDVTRRPRKGYGAVAFRIDGGRSFQVAKGRGDGPIAAVIDTYHNSIAAGFDVPAGLDVVFDAVTASVEFLPVPDITDVIDAIAQVEADIMALIG